MLGGWHFVYRPGVDGISFTVHPWVIDSRSILKQQSRFSEDSRLGRAVVLRLDYAEARRYPIRTRRQWRAVAGLDVADDGAEVDG